MASKSRKKKKASAKAKIPAKQGISKDSGHKVGYKNPPKEHQFKLGESGNPNGPPIRRTQLWVYVCQYMNMTDPQIKRLVKKKLTQSQQAALKIVDNMKEGKESGSQRLAMNIFDREEGRPVEHIVIEPGDILTDAECEEIRGTVLKNNAK